MITPTINSAFNLETCDFRHKIEADYVFKPSDFCVPFGTFEPYEGTSAGFLGRGDIAIRRKTGDWEILRMQIDRDTIRNEPTIRIKCSETNLMQIAYPIDPRMMREDIEGATFIYPNTANDGWLFGHTKAGTHHDHYLAVQTAVVSLFQPTMDAALIKRFEASNQPARNKANEKYTNLCIFRDDVLLEALSAERAEHLGHFHQNPHPEKGHVHEAVRLAVSAAKKKWAATPDSLTKYRTIAAKLTPIIALLNSPHTPETRWDKQARIEAERKAAEQEGT